MSKFKDQVQKDIFGVFLNLDEFAETHRIAGKKISCVFDDDALKERQGGEELSIANSSVMLYAKTAELGKRKQPGNTINIDGKEYIIDDWAEDMGLSTLSLHQHIVT